MQISVDVILRLEERAMVSENVILHNLLIIVNLYKTQMLLQGIDDIAN